MHRTGDLRRRRDTGCLWRRHALIEVEVAAEVEV
jgi:hypothetical protein